MAAMLYRAYTPTDRDACLAIFDSNAELFFSPGDRTDFERFLDAPPGFFGVLCDDAGKVMACGGIGVRDAGQTAVLTWGMVAADRHGQGIGKALAMARMSRLTEFPAVHKVVMNTSHETVGFYLKMGFRVVEHIPNSYRRGLDRFNLELNLADKGWGNMSKPKPEPVDPRRLVEMARAVIQAAPFPDLATIDGDQPRVRPVSPVRTDQFTVYVANLRSYHKTSEIAINPKVELCYLSPNHDQVRITGVAEVVDDRSVLQQIWDSNPLLRQYLGSIDNPELIVYRIRPARVRFMKEWALEYYEVPLE